jgi:hypothetical protein
MTSGLGSQNYETPREDTISMRSPSSNAITLRTLKQKEMMNNRIIINFTRQLETMSMTCHETSALTSI